jgi:histidinol-phosphatase
MTDTQTPTANIPIARLLELATRAACAPSSLILSGFRSPDLPFESKSDGSPVTQFDRAAERQIREVLQSEPGLLWPVLGEEFGGDTESSPYRWVVDPIDGTQPFTRGLPYFGTLVAFEETRARRALVGVIQLPAHGETYTAGRGLGAHCNGKPIRVASRRDLSQCIVSAPDIKKFRIADLGDGYERLSEAVSFFRGMGDCWMHAMAARGAIDVVVEFSLNRWDVAATEVLVEEAGGRLVLRDSKTVPGKFDTVFGNTEAVGQVLELLGFEPS